MQPIIPDDTESSGTQINVTWTCPHISQATLSAWTPFIFLRVLKFTPAQLQNTFLFLAHAVYEVFARVKCVKSALK
jgi:hypothetical protein